jgi:hypothetical protein
MTGKVWVGATHRKIQDGAVTGLDGDIPLTVTYSGITEKTARGGEIGAKLGIAGAELVGYYYDGVASLSRSATSPPTFSITFLPQLTPSFVLNGST